MEEVMKNKCKHEFIFAKVIHKEEFYFELIRQDYALLYCKNCGELLIKKIDKKEMN